MAAEDEDVGERRTPVGTGAREVTESDPGSAQRPLDPAEGPRRVVVLPRSSSTLWSSTLTVFMARIISKVECGWHFKVADTLHLVAVPKRPTHGSERDEKFLRKMYQVLLKVDVLEGNLQCPESAHMFPSAWDSQHAAD
ncbi:hypothetical protein QTO34_007229 [Cnephaeus nilssonii]|uniref:Uncharacterized protein n=1 Tax=Cnephaeus nilssonii TaxID=3371016 RepID=A0AA40HJV2_CNENI|nr:hypothetical protein QTO34_007229 [Eptesicus nilssonii]